MGRRERNGARAFEDVNGVTFVEGESALIVVTGVLVGDGDVIAACNGAAGNGEREGANLYRLVWGGK